jgi:excisionase family DNA binding protein
LLLRQNYQKDPLILTADSEQKQAPLADIMTVGELADFLHFHPSMRLHGSTIYRLLRQGAFPAFKVGSRWGFRREAIDRLVQLETK